MIQAGDRILLLPIIIIIIMIIIIIIIGAFRGVSRSGDYKQLLRPPDGGASP